MFPAVASSDSRSFFFDITPLATTGPGGTADLLGTHELHPSSMRPDNACTDPESFDETVVGNEEGLNMKQAKKRFFATSLGDLRN